MVYEEYLTEKLEEVKMLLREKTERLEEEGFRFHYDAFWETNENGKNGFIQITVSLNGKEEEQLSYYHCLCENVGRDEKCTGGCRNGQQRRRWSGSCQTAGRKRI